MKLSRFIIPLLIGLAIAVCADAAQAAPILGSLVDTHGSSGTILTMAAVAAYRSWDYWHPKRAAQKAARPTVPQLDYSYKSDDCPSGILGHNEQTGLVQLFIIENVRKQLIATARPELAELANSLPHYWAFDDAIDQLADVLTDEQKIQIHANCSREDTLQGWNMGYTPAVYIAADPAQRRGWVEGSVIPGSGAFAHVIDWPDLPALVASWVKRSALSL